MSALPPKADIDGLPLKSPLRAYHVPARELCRTVKPRSGPHVFYGYKAPKRRRSRATLECYRCVDCVPIRITEGEDKMITLYTFGPAFGLPDASPFVTKTEVLLKMAGLAYQTDPTGFRRAPKGKLPYIDDDGERIADSTFIRWHLENKYGVDFERGLSVEQRAIGWAFEKMAEDHLYWALVDARWSDDSNFSKGPSEFFQKIPAPVRPFMIALIRRKVRRALYGQGMGRHKPAEIVALGTRSITAIAEFLGNKPFLMGNEPTGVDATIFAFVAGTLCPHFDTPLRTVAERYPNLGRHIGRMTARFYPDRSEIAGCKAAA